MKPRPPALQTLKFVLIAIVLMVVADQFVFGGKRGYIEQAKRVPEAAQVQGPPPVYVLPENGAAYFEAPPSEGADTDVAQPAAEDAGAPRDVPDAPEVEVPPSIPPPAGGRERSERGGKVLVAIVIDDLGMDVKRSRRVMDLPAPVTLAFLPYAPHVREMAAAGKAKGHELIIHTPMAAMDAKANIGPGGLREGMGAAELQAAFAVMLKSFDGYVGINNHMGSRLTQQTAAMDALMPVLKERGMFFLDSKTTGTSVVAARARAAGVPYAERDVFLDHVDSAAFVAQALQATERRARKYGSAIAIGHPKDHTIAGLKAWIPTLKEKGIELVPVSRLVVE